ncbi:trans-2-enoyl-CoA reductase [Panaeolus papilionaceus]|nr:trans-2-enoyl-CoA reductase [Panaeolus papilionaceus]
MLSRILQTSSQATRSGSRFFSSTSRVLGRAVVYAQNGDPSKVLRVLTYPDLPAPEPSSVNIKFLLSPINPADINVIEGIYPSKPTKSDNLTKDGLGSTSEPVFVAGNEGLAEVTAVGDGVSNLSVGDWVIMTKQQAGTWATDRNVKAEDVLKVPDAQNLNEAQAATLTVNPPTAYNMLTEFVDLKPGDWVIQNGANSAVGQAVIQIAAARGLNTINLVRERPDFEALESKLKGIGATHVLTYNHLSDKAVRENIKSWTGGKPIRLGLNCVGGEYTTAMAKLLGSNAHLVSYGAMAKQPLSIPISLFIFKDLTCHGFWQSRWYIKKPAAQREQLMQNLVALMNEKKLDTPEHEIVTVPAEENDEVASQRIQKLMQAMSEGRYGKKVLLKMVN